jgi:hypothetical protein
MEAQIQALLGRVDGLEAENTALKALHTAPDAAASDIDDVDGDIVVGDAAQVAVDPTTNTLIVSAGAGETVRIAPVLKVGRFENVEETLTRHAAESDLCTERAAVVEAELVALRQAVADLEE